MNGFDVYIRRAVENGEVIFPEKFKVSRTPEALAEAQKRGRDFEYLDELKVAKGSFSYSAQQLNDPVDDDAIEFKREWVRRYDELPKHGVDQLFVDPAFTLKQSNDPSGIVLTRICDDNIVYVMEALKLRLNTEELINEIFRLHVVYPSIRVTYIESVAAQVMLLTLLRSEMLKRNKHFVLEEYQPSTREKKAMRIRGLIPRYQAGGIMHRHGLIDLENELLEFPRNVHDDLIDALSQGVNVWNAPSKIQHKSSDDGTWSWWHKKAAGPRLTRMGSFFEDLAGVR